MKTNKIYLIQRAIKQFVKDADTLLLWLFTDRKRLTLYLLLTGVIKGRSNCIEQAKMYSDDEVKQQLKVK